MKLNSKIPEYIMVRELRVAFMFVLLKYFSGRASLFSKLSLIDKKIWVTKENSVKNLKAHSGTGIDFKNAAYEFMASGPENIAKLPSRCMTMKTIINMPVAAMSSFWPIEDFRIMI